MAYRLQSSMSGGELDPALTKRISLNKYSSGLKTARNIIVGKTGRILSRPGRKYMQDAYNSSRTLIIPMPWKCRYAEFSAGYVEVFEADGTSVGSDTHSFTDAQLEYLQFIPLSFKTSLSLGSGGSAGHYNKGYVIMVCNPEEFDNHNFIYDNGKIENTFYYTPALPYDGTGSYSGTGYDVDYAVSAIVNGEESELRALTHASTSAQLPSPAAINTLSIDYWEEDIPDDSDLRDAVSEIRVYRRPTGGGAFGYIGSAKYYDSYNPSATPFPTVTFEFVDYGQDADFTNQPIDRTVGLIEEDDEYLLSAGVQYLREGPIRTACSYQGRTVLGAKNKILFSRPGFPNNFFRDYPLDADSALTTRITGSNGQAEIYHLVENDGLIAFTSDGIYNHRGLVSVENLGFEKKAANVADHRVRPLNIPGGTIFVDSKTNSVMQLRYSDEKLSFVADEVSIFSDHLFRENRVTSWAFDDRIIPMVWVTFADGTYASFTYQDTQEMRAWTRHDSGVGIEHVAYLQPGFDSGGDFTDGRLIFVTKEPNGNERYIEHGVNRFLKSEELEVNSEADKSEVIAAMDSMVSWSELLNDDLTDDDLTLTPVVADTWDGELTLACTDDAIFPSPGAGAVGTIFRWFNPIDRTNIDLEITARASDDSVTVQPTDEFPSTYATNMRLYKTQNTFTGLGHLDGKAVSVIVDGYVVASPNNDYENYPDLSPSSGSLDLPNGRLGAIVHIGLPYTMDVETLDIVTVEQRPTHNESLTCDKVKIETYQSRGLYVGNQFPEDNLVKGDTDDIEAGRTMFALDSYNVNYADLNPITGNRYDQPETKEIELTIPGDWRGNGRICVRQVDPIHFEILAFTPDVDDQRR